MIAFLLTIYAAVVIGFFKLKLIKPRPYPIACVLVAGVLMIGGVMVAWMLCAPVSPRVVTTQYVVQLVPYVKGQIKKVHAIANQAVRKGDLLLEINPEPYKYKVDQTEAQLNAAEENVKVAEAGREAAKANVAKSAAGIKQAQAAVNQAKAALTNAQAGVAKAKAATADAQAGVTRAKAADDLAKTEEEIAVNLQKTDSGAIGALRVTQAIQNRQGADAALLQAGTGVNQAQAAELQAEAAVNQAQATLQQTEAGLAEAQSAQQQAEAAERQAAFAVQVATSNVPAVKAMLDEARFDLTQCRMLAPADGYVVNWAVQEGTMLVPMPMAAAGTFVVTAETFIIASFPQNYLVNVQPGNDVELVLDPYPGRLFKAKVDTVIPATGEGQFGPSGAIPLAAKVGSQGLLAVKIRLIGDDAPALPLGAGGTVAIYTDHGKPVHIISKVTIRIKKWMLYVFPA